MSARLNRAIGALGLVAASVLGVLVTPAAAATSIPVDAGAGPQARSVLNWLAHVPNRALRHKVVSGYFAGYSGNSFGTQTQELTQLKTQTGQDPGVVACDYASAWTTTSPSTPTGIDTTCDDTLISASQAGSLASVSVHFPVPDPSAAWNQPLPAATLHQLTDPTTAVGQRWQAELDQVASGLQTLSNAGVPVLFRPFHEMNGNWFWWGGQSPADFAALWQSTYSYLTTTKGLHNLLWVYAPNCGSSPDADYPGATYTDIVGLDCYLDDPTQVTGYERMTALGKPFAFTEIGPGTTNGQFDYRLWINAIHAKYPRATYFLAWNNKWGPVNNLHAAELLNDPWVVNRASIDLTSPVNDLPSTPLYRFGGGLQGWTGYNVLHGPWAVTEGAPAASVKADVDLAAGPAYLHTNSPLDLSGDTTLTVTARTAPWGDQAAGSTAKLYVRTGANWYDAGALPVGSGGTTLTLDLTRIPGLNQVRDLGVQFTPAAGASGQSAVYVDTVSLTGPGKLVEGFETGADGWGKYLGPADGGPWSVCGEGAGEGSCALKANVDLAGGPVYLNKVGLTDLTGFTALTVEAGTAPWGNQASGTSAKFYIRTDSGWYDSGPVTIGPDGAVLVLDLAQVPDLNRVREIGVMFTPASGAGGGSAIYLDNLTRLT